MFDLIQCQELVSEYKTIMWSDDRMNHHELCFDHNADAAIQAALPHKQFAIDFEPAPVDPLASLSPDKREAFERARSYSEEEPDYS